MIINFSKKLFYGKYKEYITQAFNYALDLLGVPCKDIEVNVNFISAKQIRELNNTHRHKDCVTDVLSFPSLLQEGVENEQLIVDLLTKENYPNDINLDNNHIFLGDICICPKVVRRQAKRFGNTMARELVYMSVHGLLHLLGFDHVVDKDKKHMREVEENIMKKVNLGRD